MKKELAASKKFALISVEILILIIIYRSCANDTPSQPTSVEERPRVTSDVQPASVKNPQEIKKTLSNFRKKLDKIEQVVWYSSHPQSDTFSNRIEAYIGDKGGLFFLRMKIMYRGDDWVFMDRVKFVIDGSPMEYQFGVSDVKRDNSVENGESVVYEWSDTFVKKEQYVLLKKIASGKKVEMRYIGRQYKNDRKISQTEIQSISKILKAFEDIGGVID